MAQAKGSPAPAIEMVAVDDLTPYARNARTHSAAQIDQIAGSIREFGFIAPVVIDAGGTIVAGHGRVMAAERLGLDRVPAIRVTHLTETQVRAYVLADNRIAENAGWDDELLRVELSELQDAGMDLGLVGFTQDELDEMFAGEVKKGLTDPDAAPAAEADPISREGDVWILGRHRLVCGDCTDAGVVAQALDGAKPHLMVTDPPYGVEYDPAWRAKATGSEVAGGKVLNDDQADWSKAWALFPGVVAYVWHSALHELTVARSLMEHGFELRAQIIWVKHRAAFGRGHYHWQHEPAFYAVQTGEDDRFRFEHDAAAYAVKKGKPAGWKGGRKESTVWFIEHLKNDTGHGTQKPVDCMLRPILNNSSEGQAVYEPFAGSGTTLIAAEQSNRACHAIELNPIYVDVIIRRWQDFAGAKARLGSANGKTFERVARERAKERETQAA